MHRPHLPRRIGIVGARGGVARAAATALPCDLGWADDGIADPEQPPRAPAAEHYFLMFAQMQVRERDFNVRVVGRAAN